jgi:hypothetical protein
MVVETADERQGPERSAIAALETLREEHDRLERAP